MLAIILFYFKVEPRNEIELAKYWGYIESLEKIDILPAAQVPFGFTKRKL